MHYGSCDTSQLFCVVWQSLMNRTTSISRPSHAFWFMWQSLMCHVTVSYVSHILVSHILMCHVWLTHETWHIRLCEKRDSYVSSVNLLCVSQSHVTVSYSLSHDTLQHTATHRTATHCNTLQHTALQQTRNRVSHVSHILMCRCLLHMCVTPSYMSHDSTFTRLWCVSLSHYIMRDCHMTIIRVIVCLVTCVT